MSSSNIYYVYAYLREKDSKTATAGTPYYIGKGKSRRFLAKHSVPIPSEATNIQFIAVHLSESESFLLERRLISIYGRKNNGTGILLNLTDGGEGCSGRVVSEDTKDKIRAKRKLQVFTEETIDKFRTRRHSDETKRKMSMTHQKLYSEGRRIISDEHKTIISNSSRTRIVSDETKQKIRLARASQVMKPITDETRKKMSESQTGRVSPNKGKPGKPHTEETKKKIRDSRLNQKMSQETKDKIRLSMINKYKNK